MTTLEIRITLSWFLFKETKGVKIYHFLPIWARTLWCGSINPDVAGLLRYSVLGGGNKSNN